MASWQPRHTRLLVVVFILCGVAAATGLTLMGLAQNVTYFHSPSDVKAKAETLLKEGKVIRIGGLVEKGSVRKEGEGGLDMTFIVTDLQETLTVHYHGLPPDLFRDGQGIVAEGLLQDDGAFVAKTLLAKHDENYMPPEVAKSLHKKE